MESLGSQNDVEKREKEKAKFLEEGRVLRDSSGTNLEDGTLSINNVRLGDGCRQSCIHCGAYDQMSDKLDLIANAVIPERMKEVLEQEFLVEISQEEGEEDCEKAGENNVEGVNRYVKRRIIDLFANYVTTDVNQEPLDTDAFLQFAKLVKKLSGGNSRAVCVTHGVTMKGEKSSEEQIRRLREIVDFMGEYDVFVLSLDFSRLGGKIDYKTNLDSYATTINELKPAIEKGVHVTVSIQGDDEKDSPYNRTRAVNFYDKVKKKLEQDFGWDPRLFNNIVVETERAWVNKGRAKLLPGVDPDGQCPVIPDERFVYNHLKSATMAGYLDMITGGVYMHPYNAHRTYNDVLAISRKLCGRTKRPSKCSWEQVGHGKPLTDLSYAFTREGKRELLNSKRKLARLLRLDSESRGQDDQVEEVEEEKIEEKETDEVQALASAEETSEFLKMSEETRACGEEDELFPGREEHGKRFRKEILEAVGRNLNICVADMTLKTCDDPEEVEYLEEVNLWDKIEKISSEDEEERREAEKELVLRLGESKARESDEDKKLLRLCSNRLRERMFVASVLGRKNVWEVTKRLLQLIERPIDLDCVAILETIEKRKGASEEEREVLCSRCEKSVEESEESGVLPVIDPLYFVRKGGTFEKDLTERKRESLSEGDEDKEKKSEGEEK